MKLIASYLWCWLFIICCNPEEIDTHTFEEFDIHTFGDSSGGTLTDSVALSKNLIGSWQWTEEHCQCCISCSCVKSSWTTLANKDVIATFSTNNTFSVSEEGSVVITGNWSVQQDTVGGFLISLSDQNYYNHYFTGSVNITETQMLADSFSGCNQLFLKISGYPVN